MGWGSGVWLRICDGHIVSGLDLEWIVGVVYSGAKKRERLDRSWLVANVLLLDQTLMAFSGQRGWFGWFSEVCSHVKQLCFVIERAAYISG